MKSLPRLGLHLLLASLTVATGFAQTAWHRLLPVSPGIFLRDIAANDERFVAVGRAGAVVTSTDGHTWTERDLGSYEALTSVGRFQNGFLAIGENGTVFHSPDGLSWSQRLGGAGITRWATDQSIAVLLTGSTETLTLRLSNDGINWEQVTVPFQPLDVSFVGGRFFALAKNALMHTSTDGRTWAPVSVVENGLDGTRMSLPIGSPTGPGPLLSILDSTPTTKQLFRSTDGRSWNPVSPASPPDQVFWRGGRFFLKTSDQSTLASDDGLTWTPIEPLPAEGPKTAQLGNLTVEKINLNLTVDGVASPPLITARRYNQNTLPAAGAVIFSAGRWITADGYTSTDGATWTDFPALPDEGNATNTLRTLSVANGRIFVINNLIYTPGATLWSSTDGVSFARSTDFAAKIVPTVTYANGIYLLTDTAGTTVFRSTDGVTWTSDPLIPPASAIEYVEAVPTVIVGLGDHFLLSGRGTNWGVSTDGLVWQALEPNDTTPQSPSGLTYHDGVVVAFNTTNQLLWTSADGVTWTTIKTPLQVVQARQVGANLVIAGTRPRSQGVSFVATRTAAGVWTQSAFPALGSARGIATDGTRTLAVIGENSLAAQLNQGPQVTAITPTETATLLASEVPGFTVTATSSQSLSYQWSRAGIDIPGATQSMLTQPLTQDTGGLTETFVVKISDGTSIVSAVVPAIVYSATPPSRIGDGLLDSPPSVRSDGAIVHHLVARFDGPLLTYQWYRDDTALPGATSWSLDLLENTSTIGHRYHVTAINGAGQMSSVDFTVPVPAPPEAPATPTLIENGYGVGFFLQSASVPAGALLQWRFNGQPLPEVNGNRLYFDTSSYASQPVRAGFYDVVAYNAAGATVSPAFRLEVPDQPSPPATAPAYPIVNIAPARLTNLSVRSPVAADDQALVAGFVVDHGAQRESTGTTAVLIRGAGPSLAPFGVADPLSAPRLELYAGAQRLAENLGWQDQSTDLDPIFTQVGAFKFAAQSHDTALLQLVPAGEGTAVFTSTLVPAADTASGEGLIEVYAVPGGNGSSLSNLSARGYLRPDRSLSAGFVFTGTPGVNVLIRAVGTGLQRFGISPTATSPKLVLRDATGAIVSTYQYFGADLNDIAARLGGFPLVPADHDTAAYAYGLRPGAYTITAESTTAGAVLLEVYYDPLYPSVATPAPMPDPYPGPIDPLPVPIDTIVVPGM